MEILSPAGNFSSLISAVRCGADAVYFGIGDFNARRNAENFSENDLKEISVYCHVRGVKAYLALNTLVSDDEIPAALNIVKKACEAGIDAIIINDSGLAEIIRKSAPNMPLHASTQMTIHNISGVEYLKNKGFKRVVLARENSLSDIKKIAEYANKNNIEIEIFVQGAHCMSVSGQCLLSSVLGSRSGNRGLCAQPCRLPFKVNNGSGYDLSLKDMNLYNYFDEFEKLNIASLKIEGRMKNAEYAAAATYAAACAKNNSTEKYDSLNILKDIFSRSGFTDGYLTEKIDKKMFGIRSELDIEKSKQIKNSIHNLYRRELQSIPVSITAEFKNGIKSKLTVSDSINTVTVFNEIPEKAVSKSTSADEISEKLKKTGSTPYFIEENNITLDEHLFVSGKTLSSLKNDALNKLSEIRGKIKPVPFNFTENNQEYKNYETKTEKFISLHSLEQMPEKQIADLFFVPLSSNIEEVKKYIDNGYTIGIKTPIFFNELSDKRLKNFREIGVEHALMQNIGAYIPLKNNDFIITCAPSLNIFNSYSLENCPADYCTLSVELSESQINNIKSNKPKGILAYGKLPLMIFKNCPIKTNNGCNNCSHKITDRKNIDFKIYCEDSVTKMINNRPLYIGDKQHLFKNMDFILLSFTDETKEDIQNILKLFENGSELKEPYTRGLYFKGVL